MRARARVCECACVCVCGVELCQRRALSQHGPEVEGRRIAFVDVDQPLAPPLHSTARLRDRTTAPRTASLYSAHLICALELHDRHRVEELVRTPSSGPRNVVELKHTRVLKPCRRAPHRTERGQSGAMSACRRNARGRRLRPTRRLTGGHARALWPQPLRPPAATRAHARTAGVVGRGQRGIHAATPAR